MMIRWRGHGWLSFLMLFAAPWPVVGLLQVAGLPMAAAFIVAAAAAGSLNYVVGRSLNSTVTSKGRAFHNRHEFMGAPMQHSSRWFVGAVVFLATGATVAQYGGETAGNIYFGVVLGALVAAALIVRARRGRVYPVRLPGELALAGGPMTFTLEAGDVVIDIPANVKSGAVVRAPGQGPAGKDLYVRVLVQG